MTNRCRNCGAALSDVFVDLGTSPPSNAFLSDSDLQKPETWYPLVVYLCSECLLVQLPVHEIPKKIFGEEYLYFSGFSKSWLEHTRDFADKAVEQFGLDKSSRVLEVGSNDGSTLRHFQERGIEVCGVDPAPNVAAHANQSGIPTLCYFFGENLGRLLEPYDLVHGANVFAHVPDIHDFARGLHSACKSGGVVTLEFPHLERLLSNSQFDTIYHEHFSYFTLATARHALHESGLYVWDAEELPTHGGSLRLYASPTRRTPTGRLLELLSDEAESGLHDAENLMKWGRSLQENAEQVKRRLLRTLLDSNQVAGFGAPAKATTLLNFCGVRRDLLPYVTDDNPNKQGRYMPGSRIPILSVEDLIANSPETVVILPWNIRKDALGRLEKLSRGRNRFFYPLDPE